MLLLGLYFCLCLSIIPNNTVEASFITGGNSNNNIKSIPIFQKKKLSLLHSTTNDENNENYLKEELTKYLQKREEVDADEIAKSEVGRVVGGTKGNAVLNFVSGSINDEIIIEDIPDTFDYSELCKYGFDYLTEPIMEAGGRLEMYKLMEIEAPTNKIKMKKFGPMLQLDKVGTPLEDKNAGYKGLGMSTLLDDDLMGQQLQQAAVKKEKLKSVSAKERFLGNKPKDGSKTAPNPYWTAQSLDEYGKRRGKVADFYRQVREKEIEGGINDPDENLAIDGSSQTYSILTSMFVAFAFAKSNTVSIGVSEDIQRLLQLPAVAILVGNLASSFYTSTIVAPTLKRNGFIWGIKGFAGGPVAVLQLQKLTSLGKKEAKE